jgi:dipeptidyl aminopeptidase/acylaminoacyl peptidase
MAGVLDMRLAFEHGDYHVRDVLGGTPAQIPERYAIASPIEHIPFGVPVTVLQGTDDTVVPPEQAETFVKKARAAGDQVTLIMLPNTGHGEFSFADSSAWAIARSAIIEHVLPETRPMN